MRLTNVTPAQRRLLDQLSGRISNRLEAEFVEVGGADGASIGVALSERGKRVSVEIPEALLLQAESDSTARDAVRVRIKAARDRMLFRPPPHHPSNEVRPAGEPWLPGGGFRGGGRGRR